MAEADRLGCAKTSKSDVDYLDYYREDYECGILGRMLDLADVGADDERLDTPRIADDLSDIEVCCRPYARILGNAGQTRS